VRAGSQELVLVCAPAAFSKTALLAYSVGRATVRWTRRGNRPVDHVAGAHSPAIPPMAANPASPPPGTPSAPG
jgi:hypothetical protein